jgi:hypothetical protein
MPQVGKDDMSETRRCETEKMLIDLVEDALVKLERSKESMNEAHMELITARTLWDQHKMACPVCSQQMVN